MVPPAGEHLPEAPPADGQRPLPTPFLTKTFQLVDDPAIDDIISWNDDGSTFVVWRPAEFSRDLLPKYFKHNNFSSFVRQLNTYGFRKIVPDRWEFANDCFRRGERRLLCDIHRRKIVSAGSGAGTGPALVPVAAPSVPVAPARIASPSNSGEEPVISSNSSPVNAAALRVPCGSMAELADENERLRRENCSLSHELSQIKGLCSNILVLMTKYAGGQFAECASASASTPVAVAFENRSPLDLMPMRSSFVEVHESGSGSGGEAPAQCLKAEGEEAVPAPAMGCPMLFGFALGTKRPREERRGKQYRPSDSHLHRMEPCSNADAVKSEPLDSESDQHDDVRGSSGSPCRTLNS